MRHLEECRVRENEDPELAEEEREMQTRMQEEARQRIADLRAQHQKEPEAGVDDSDDDSDDFDDDDYDVEVEYVP